MVWKSYLFKKKNIFFVVLNINLLLNYEFVILFPVFKQLYCAVFLSIFFFIFLCEQYYLTCWWVFSSSYTGRLSDSGADWSGKAENTGQSLPQYLPGAAEYTTRRGARISSAWLTVNNALEFTWAVMLNTDERVDWLINKLFCKAISHENAMSFCLHRDDNPFWFVIAGFQRVIQRLWQHST